MDFSGATDAGKRIWIAEATRRDEYLSVHACYAAGHLPGSGVARGPAIRALRDLIDSRRDAAFGIDVPFGLPKLLVTASAWTAFARGFVGRHADADAFKSACLGAAGGRELKRLTDRQARTPFCAYNLRLYKQTFHALNDLVGPLVAADAAVAIPMQPRVEDRAVLLEVCPASTLMHYGVRVPYKKATQKGARARLVNWLVQTMPMAIPAAIRQVAVNEPNGDAVDALVAAAATARALHAQPSVVPAHRLEGYVYL